MPAAMPLALFDDEDKGLVQPATFLGRFARGADLGKLKTAETMLEYKRPMDAIRKETGWFQGLDGKWRFEIPDNEMHLTPQGTGIPAEGGLPRQGVTAPMERQIHHPQLYENYPQMRTIPTTIRNAPAGGSYYPPQTAIPTGLFPWNKEGPALGPMRPPRIEINAPTHGVGRPIGIHEGQHAVQNIEGFARGGNPTEMEGIALDVENMIQMKTRQLEETALKRERARSPAMREKHDDRFYKLLNERTPLYDYTNPMGLYRRLSGEIEANLAARRGGMTAADQTAHDPIPLLRQTDPDKAPDRQPQPILSFNYDPENPQPRFETGVPLIDALFKPGRWR